MGNHLPDRLVGIAEAGVRTEPKGASRHHQGGLLRIVEHRHRLEVEVDADVDATLQRALDAGGRLVAGPTEPPYGGRTVTVSDPEGNLFCLVAD